MAAIDASGGKTVLVVDDDDSLRMLCRINLELEGYSVVEASSIERAQEVLAAGPVDAILLDLHVGHGDGRQLIASLGTPRPPVALFTGSEAIGPELRSLADAVLAKPFGIDLLAETVGRLIEDAGRAGRVAP
ncbi:MAG TPA: response regulator [Gaiellaceae bacterium]|nr:response regulator [Gaiellaceae bacterium]